MAGTIGTNVTPDGSTEIELANKILQLLEDLYMRKESTLEAKNAKIIADHIGQGGGLGWKMTERKFEEPLKKALQANKIPYSVAYDNQGHSIFIIRDQDSDAFNKIQHDIFAMDTDYYAQISKEDICRIAKNNGDKDVVVLKFKKVEDFEEAQTKLYGNGVVCAIDKDAYTLIVNPSDLYNAKGSDLTSIEMSWALNQSMNDEMFGGSNEKDSNLQKLRNDQASYDIQVIKTFSKALQEGKEMVVVDGQNTSKYYMESNDKGLKIHEQDENGNWRSLATLSREDLEKMKPEEIGALISKYKFEIKNAIILDNHEDKANILDVTSEAAKQWSEQHKWEGVDGRTYKVRPTNPSDEFRNVINLTAKEKEAQTIKVRDLKEMLSSVEIEARKRVEARSDVGTLSPTQKRALLKNEIVAILKEARVTEIRSFLDSPNSHFTREDKEAWLKNITKHFDDTHESLNHEMQIDEVKIKDLEKELREQERQLQEKETEKEKEQEQEEKASEENNGRDKGE